MYEAILRWVRLRERVCVGLKGDESLDRLVKGGGEGLGLMKEVRGVVRGVIELCVYKKGDEGSIEEETRRKRLSERSKDSEKKEEE